MKTFLKFKHFEILIICTLFCVINSCAPKLNFSEIKDRINEDYKAFNNGNIEYEIKNTPKEYLKDYGELNFRNKLITIYSKRTNQPYFDDIGELRIQARNKCNSTYYYKVKYIIDKAQMTPFIDSIALEKNYENYGKDNVNFNTNSEILQVRQTEEQLLIFDKDKIWKLLPFNDLEKQTWVQYYGNKFSDCINSKVKRAENITY